jgi:hypothetical protein
MLTDYKKPEDIIGENLRRVARLVLRISTRAVSVERVAPAISVEILSGLLPSGMSTRPALAEGRRSRLPALRCRRQSTPCFG